METGWAAAYGFISAFGAFFLWYSALRRGGSARIEQLQLIQPFLTLASSAGYETYSTGWHSFILQPLQGG